MTQPAKINVLDALMKKKIIRGIKLYPGYQHVYPNDKRLDPIFKMCQKRGFPVIFHTGDTIGYEKGAMIRFSQPLPIDDVAVRFPELNIIVAHLGNPWTEDCAELLLKNENVYADLSGFFYHFKDKRYNNLVARKINDAIAYATGAKLLFGTDWPLIGMKEHMDFLLANLDLTREERENMLHANAEKLFGI